MFINQLMCGYRDLYGCDRAAARRAKSELFMDGNP